MLRVRVLGGLELEADGRALELPARGPARVLLGWLALHPGTHSRSAVAATLWPDVRDESARVSLRSALSALRAALGPAAGAVLETSRTHVALAGEPNVWVDAREFERLAGHDPGGALALSRGPLLAGFEDDWILTARDGQREREGDLLRRLADAADARTAVGLARRRAALDLFDEAAHRDLMVRLVRAGDRAGALASYERLAERLRRELGVAPSPATRALAGELRTGPATTAAAPAVSVPVRLAAVRRRGRIVGRERELARLRALRARPGRVAVLLTGEPGIGKTRLLAELAAELTREGTVVLYGREEDDALIPYGAVADSLRDRLELSTLDAAGRSVTGEPAPGARARLFEEVGAALDTLAAGRALALLLDDLHWIEPATARLISHLATRADGAPALLVLACRDTEIGPDHPLRAAITRIRRDVDTERVALEGLDRDGVAAMAGGEHDASALRTRTGGNPFFVEEMLRAGDDAQPSDGVVDSVARRAHALGPGAHALLTAGAVAGAEFDAGLAGEVVGLSEAAGLDTLDAAVRARLLVESPAGPTRFAFTHALVRDALLRPLTAARRARLHALLADALESRMDPESDADLAELATHALEAARGSGDPLRAADLAERAAARAGALLAHEDAAELMRRSVAMLERRGVAPGRRAEALCVLGEALQRAGETGAAAERLERARELARIAGRPDMLARATLAASGVGVAIVDVDHVKARRLEECVAALGDGHDELRVRMLARLAIELGYDADRDRRESAGAQALALARTVATPRALAVALSARHVTLWGPEHLAERLDLAAEMVDLGYRAGDPELALQGRNWRISDLFEAGDGPGVRAELDAYAALAAEARLPAYSWWVPTWSATIALLEGRLAEGMELSRRARELGARAGDPNAAVITAQHELMRATIKERFEEMDPVALAERHPVNLRAGSGPAWRAYRLTFAWIHAERGEIDASRRNLDAALDGGVAAVPRDVNWLAAMSSAAQACVKLGDRRLARELRLELAPYADRMAVSARGACHGGSVAYLLAVLAALCGDTADAERCFEDAARRDARAGAPVWVTRDRRHHAALLDASADRVRAARS